MSYKYIVIGSESDSLLPLRAIIDDIEEFQFRASVSIEKGADAILDIQPDLVFINVSFSESDKKNSIQMINELYFFIDTIPEIVLISEDRDFAYEAIKHDIFDYIVLPFDSMEVQRILKKFDKKKKREKDAFLKDISMFNSPLVKTAKKDVLEYAKEDKTKRAKSGEGSSGIKDAAERHVIAVKSYSDWKFVPLDELEYIKADNDAVDLYLRSGEIVTSYKSMLFIEKRVPLNFFRVHRSYIVNSDFVQRVHLGTKNFCVIKNAKKTQIPIAPRYRRIVASKMVAYITKGDINETTVDAKVIW